MIRLDPEWIGDLVAMCARDDWADMSSPLAFPTVSPMFRKLLPEMAHTDEVTGYSSVEMQACKAGIEWLSKAHPVEYAALAWEFQRWRRAREPRAENHKELVILAGKLLAEFVDKECQ